MISFFRDVLDGPLYIITTILSIIFIMAIIGFLMERKKLEKQKKEQVAVVDIKQPITPITPVSVENQEEVQTSSVVDSSPVDVPTMEEASLEVKTPVIVFNDPDQKDE